VIKEPLFLKVVGSKQIQKNPELPGIGLSGAECPQ
jgi:hypothetical protein